MIHYLNLKKPLRREAVAWILIDVGLISIGLPYIHRWVPIDGSLRSAFRRCLPAPSRDLRSSRRTIGCLG